MGNNHYSFCNLFDKKIIDKNSNVTETPKFLSYKKDKIHSFYWKWEWRYNQNSLKWNVTGIKPLCPKCETAMHYDYSSMNYGYTANCPRCHYQNNQIPNYNDIEALIIDNVDRGNF